MSDSGPLGEAFVDVAFRLDRASEAALQRQVQQSLARVDRASGGFAAGAVGAERALEGAASAAGQLDQAASEAASGGIADVATTVSGLDAALSRFGRIAETRFTMLGRSGDLVARSFIDLDAAGKGAAAGGIAAVTLATTAAVGAAVKSIGGFVRLGREVREFSERSGANAEQSSRFVAVLDDYRIGSEAAANGLFTLGRNIDANSKQLEAQGLRIARTRDGAADLQETFFNLADAVAATNDPAERFSLIQNALGRQGRELIRVLELGGQTLRDEFGNVPLGQVFTQADLDAIEQYDRATDDLSDSFRDLGLGLSRSVIPALTGVVKLTTTLVDKGAELGRSRGYQRFLDNLSKLNPQIAALRFLGDRLSDVGRESDSLAKKEREITERSQEAADALDEQSQALLRLADARIGERDAARGLESANDRVAEAQERLNVTLARGGKFAEDQARAEEALADAKERVLGINRRLRDSEEAITDARAALEEARFFQGRGSREAIEAERELRNAKEDRDQLLRDRSDSVDDIEKAERDLAAARRAGGAGSKEAIEAERDLRGALDAQEKAYRSVARAEAERRTAQRAANGETVTAATVADEYRSRLEALAATLAPGSDLRRNLIDTAATLAAVNDLVGAGPLLPGQERAPVPVGGRSLSGPAPEAAGVSSLAPGAVTVEQNFYNQQDPVTLASDTAWLLSTTPSAGPTPRTGKAI